MPNLIKLQRQDNKGNVLYHHTSADIVAFDPTNSSNIPESVNNVQKAIESIDSGKATQVTYTATITASGFNSSAPYTETITVKGILSTDNPIIDVVLPSNSSDASSVLDDWGLVSKITTAKDSITVTCFDDKPSADIPIQIKVIR